jgi:FkbM family methyltransferase
MKTFPEWFTRNRVLNRGYRWIADLFPTMLFWWFGRPVPGLQRLGSGYGGWHVPVSELGPDSVIYSAGIGVDVTFDEAVIATTGCRVFGFDPTPFAIDFIATRESSAAFKERFTFTPVGLWDSETTLTFFAPRTRGWVGSFSALNLQGTSEQEAVKAPVERLSHLMKRLGHSRLDVLKMDIEGAEYRSIDNLIANQLDVRWLCIEFDQPVPIWTTVAAIRRLRTAGYELCNVEKWNFVFRRVASPN